MNRQFEEIPSALFGMHNNLRQCGLDYIIDLWEVDLYDKYD